MDTSFFPYYADIVGLLQSRCHEYLSPQKVQKDSKIKWTNITKLSQLVPCTWVKSVLRLHNNITFLSLLDVSSNEEIGWLDMRIPFHQPVFHKASRRRIDKFSRIVDRTELPAKRWKGMGCNNRRMIQTTVLWKWRRLKFKLWNYKAINTFAWKQGKNEDARHAPDN